MTGGFKLFTPVDAFVAEGMTIPVWALRLAGACEVLGALGLVQVKRGTRPAQINRLAPAINTTMKRIDMARPARMKSFTR